MIKVKVWRLLSAHMEHVEHDDYLACSGNDGITWPCVKSLAWTVAWTVNESGLPGLGESRTDYVCGSHLVKRLHCIPFEYTGSVTITPYTEVEA